MPADEAAIIAELQTLITPASVDGKHAPIPAVSTQLSPAPLDATTRSEGSAALRRAQHEAADEGTEIQVRRGACASPLCAQYLHATERPAWRGSNGQGVREQKPWISEQVTSIVKELSAAKAAATDETDAGAEPAVSDEPPTEEAVAPAAVTAGQSAASATAGGSPPEPEEAGSLVVGGIALEGLWLSSAGKAMLVCKGRTVTFVSSAKTYALTFSDGRGCQMDGWTLVPEQSDTSTLRWEKEGAVITWEFEGTLDEAPPIGRCQPVRTRERACGTFPLCSVARLCDTRCGTVSVSCCRANA